MLNVLTLEKLFKFIRSKGRAIVSVNSAGGPYCVINSLHFLGQGQGSFGCDFEMEGTFAELIEDKEVIFAFVMEVVVCNLLPWTIRDVSGLPVKPCVWCIWDTS